MVISALIKGITLGLLLSISVGPVIFSIIKQSLNNGHKGGYCFIAGVSASDIFLVLICNLFAGIFNTIMVHELVIGIAGSCLLATMGIYNIFFRKSKTDVDKKIVHLDLHWREMLAIFSSAFFLNTLNPGAFLFWFATTATITADSNSESSPIQFRLGVFIVALSFNLGADILKVLLANKLREKLTPRNIHIVNIFSGLILIGFAIAIITGLLIKHASV